MTAQLVADLKYLSFMRNVSDWWTWSAPGPGSQRGLNIVLGLETANHWNMGDWGQAIKELQSKVNPLLEETGIDQLHAQDLQNCLCEYSKYTKTLWGLGRPRQIFRSF
jgi:hypothetical protein